MRACADRTIMYIVSVEVADMLNGTQCVNAQRDMGSILRPLKDSAFSLDKARTSLFLLVPGVGCRERRDGDAAPRGAPIVLEM